MSYQMLRDGRSGRIHLFTEDCWLLHEWVEDHIGLDEKDSAHLRRIDLAEMEEYSTGIMNNPNTLSGDYLQAKTIHDAMVRTFKEMSPVARIEYREYTDPTPLDAD